MKKIIIIASVILIFIIIIFSVILGRKSPVNTSSTSPFPTSVPIQESNQQNNRPSSETAIKNTGENQGLTDLTSSTDSTDLTGLTSLNLSSVAPVETEDFKLQYSFQLNKIVVEKKTPQAEEQFINWASQNQLTRLIENPGSTLIVDLGKNPDDINPLLEFLNIFMNFGQGVGSSTQNLPTGQATPSLISNPQPNLTPIPNVSPHLTPSISPGGKVYFAQCNSYGNLSLPSGCDLCYAGCGPTAVAMIAASYLGSNYNPKTIVDIYKSKGYLLGCAGSRYSDAKQVLQSLGLKTTDYLVFDSEKSDTVVPELKNYLNAGWTFFALANFRVAGGGHFFWITDIDDQGNIFAYDPYYGRYQIPYNENSRYPYPLYRVAFGVKK